MADQKYDVDPEIRLEFIDEATDGLDSLTNLFIKLEQDTFDVEIVESIFRVIHSIKGNSAYFELMKVKSLSHGLETILDQVRKGKLAASQTVTDVLLQGSDELTAMLERVRDDQPEVEDNKLFEALLENVGSIAEKQDVDSLALIENLLDILHIMKKSPIITIDQSLSGTVNNAFDSAEKLAELIGLSKTKETSDEIKMDSLPEPIRSVLELLDSPDEDELDDDTTAEVGIQLDNILRLVENTEAQLLAEEIISDYHACVKSIGLDPLIREVMTDKIKKLITQGIIEGTIIQKEDIDDKIKDDVQPISPDKKSSKKESTSEKTMRVREDSIDLFLSFVGDLVGIGEMYDHIHTRIQEITSDYQVISDLRYINESFHELSNKLQKSIMDVRKVPVQNLLQRLPRIIRDIAKSLSKEIETQIEGKGLLVDKSIIDTLESPIVHLVRNAADHGIELPDERKAAGKSLTGLITIDASEEDDYFILKIIDDGRGIDLEALRKKCVTLGIIEENDEPSQDEIFNLLLSSGVSTAKKVTDVSGRGVGMDVVKRNIDAIGGQILISSLQGLGSEFTVKLPKTVSTQIFTCLTVIVCSQQFAIPIDSIVRCFRPNSAEVTTILEKGECVKDGEELFPIRHLSDFLELQSKKSAKIEEGVLVIVETKSENLALHVDDIAGIKQVVLKEIFCIEMNQDFIRGGAIMGDGTIALILDLEYLNDKATLNNNFS